MGLLVLCRNGSRFTEVEAKQADEVGKVAVTAVRRSLLLSGMDTGTIPDAPGLLILDGQAEVSASPTAREWLEDLPEDNKQLPYAVRAVVTRARSRARTWTGRWAALHAWRLSQAMTAVAIGPAEPGELAAIVLDAYGLTTREREVTQQVLRGSTAQIAEALGVHRPGPLEGGVRQDRGAVAPGTDQRSLREALPAELGRPGVVDGRPDAVIQRQELPARRRGDSGGRHGRGGRPVRWTYQGDREADAVTAQKKHDDHREQHGLRHWGAEATRSCR